MFYDPAGSLQYTALAFAAYGTARTRMFSFYQPLACLVEPEHINRKEDEQHVDTQRSSVLKQG